MIRRLLLAAVTLLAANGASPDGITAGRFDVKLSTEQRIQQALNRLTFGARPGDIEEVRRLGVEKWIALQLHPERIAENPVLETRLIPPTPIRMKPAEILTKYFRQFPPGFAPPVR